MRYARWCLLVALVWMTGVEGPGLLAGRAGSIAGTVTDAGTTAPIAGVSVQVFNEAGQFVASDLTDVAGAWDVSVAPGTYFVRTFNTQHYINQLHSGLQCVGSCPATQGTPVVVADLTTETVDFALARGGAIAGTVTSELGPALGPVPITVVDAGNQFVMGLTTDGAGAYLTTEGLPDGTYFVRTGISTFSPSGVQGYINELYDDVPCLTPGCALTSATGVPVTAPATTGGIDFVLRPGGRFAGQVTDGITGLAGVQVEVLTAAGQRVALGMTDATGHYATAEGVPTGAYFLRTQNAGGFINRFHDGTECAGAFCSVSTLTPLAVTEGATVAGVDFALAPGGRFAGVVTSGATPLANVTIQVFTASGASVTSGTTDATGAYLTRDGLPPGTYYLRTFNGSGYVNELYDGLACAPTCTVSLGTPLTVAGPGTTSGINFDLAPGGRMTGLVVDAVTLAPQGGVSVNVVNATGAVFASGFTNANGRYTTDAGLPTGAYYLRTANSRGLINEVHGDIACNGSLCPNGVGTLVAVTAGAPPVTVDLDLAPGARIAGQVTDVASGTPLVGAGVQVLNATGQVLTSASTDALGRYISQAGLLDGAYLVRTTNGLGYIDQLHSGQSCGTSCNLAAGTPVGVAGAATTPGVDFALASGGTIAGVVTDGVMPLSSVTVQVFNPAVPGVFSASTDTNGVYAVRGLPDGTYYARTLNSRGYINETYDDIPCVFQCSSTTLGTPLTISGGAAIGGIDFALAAGGRVAGVVVDAVTALPLAGVPVVVVDAAGLTASSATTDLSGQYVTGAGLAAGTYFVRTSNTAGYLNELFDNVPCGAGCVPATGAPVGVLAGVTTTGINFALDPGGRVTGVITDQGTGTPLQSVTVQVFDVAGRFVSSGFSNAAGVYVSGAGLPAGTYYARTANGQGYIDELYDDTPCPVGGCPVTGGQAFVVAAGGTTSGINFALEAGGRVSGLVTDAITGAPIGNVGVTILDATGRVVASGTTNAFGHYTTQAGLPTGAVYYARTANGLGYINELYGGVICLGNCLVTTGTPFAVTSPATTSGINFQLQAGGRIAGTVTDAGAAPVSGVSVTVFTTEGVAVSGGATNALGQYVTTAGLPAGTYYARTSNNRGLINERYDDQVCLGACDVTAGTAVPVPALGALVGGIDFDLATGGRIAGTVMHALTAQPLAGILVEVFDGAGTLVGGAQTDGNGAFLTGSGLPAGTYYARTQNTQGLINQVYSGLDCDSACVATTGTAIAVSAGVTAGGVTFTLGPDADADGDGIADTIDLQPAVFSDAFSDVPQGGTTDGVISQRDTWTVQVGDVSPGGVEVRITGAGTLPASADVCATGGAERVSLDVAGEAAAVSCTPAGSTVARALVATPVIELRDPPTGPGVVVLLTTGQAATLGSPVEASVSNTEPITVLITDGDGAIIGSFELDPGEQVDVIVQPDGTVEVTVLAGIVTVTVRGESETIETGEAATFPGGFQFTGFVAPVQNAPAVNVATAGSTVPVKFSLGGAFGLQVLAPGSPQSQPVVCSTLEPIAPGVAAGTTGPGLAYDEETGLYTFLWRTERAWAGSCRQFTLTLSDGTTATAQFRFR